MINSKCIKCEQLTKELQNLKLNESVVNIDEGGQIDESIQMRVFWPTKINEHGWAYAKGSLKSHPLEKGKTHRKCHSHGDHDTCTCPFSMKQGTLSLFQYILSYIISYISYLIIFSELHLPMMVQLKYKYVIHVED